MPQIKPQSPYQQPPAPQPPIPPPPAPARPRRFRGWIIWLLLLLMVFAWTINSLDVKVTWESLLTRWGIHKKERYSQLAILGVVICCVLQLVRIVRDSRKD